MCISFRKQNSFHCQRNRAQNSCDWLEVTKTSLREESLSCQWCWGTQRAQMLNTQGDVSTRREDASNAHWIKTYLGTSLLVITGEKHKESRDTGKHTECRITALPSNGARLRNQNLDDKPSRNLKAGWEGQKGWRAVANGPKEVKSHVILWSLMCVCDFLSFCIWQVREINLTEDDLLRGREKSGKITFQRLWALESKSLV